VVNQQQSDMLHRLLSVETKKNTIGRRKI